MKEEIHAHLRMFKLRVVFAGSTCKVKNLLDNLASVFLALHGNNTQFKHARIMFPMVVWNPDTGDAWQGTVGLAQGEAMAFPAFETPTCHLSPTLAGPPEQASIATRQSARATKKLLELSGREFPVGRFPAGRGGAADLEADLREINR